MAEHLLEETFTVTGVDPDGKKFDRVSRIEAKSHEMYMQLDVATEVYPLKKDEQFTMVLTTTLNLDGTPDSGYYTQAARKTLADNYEEIYASFGGLLMLLKVEPGNATNFELDQKLFLLIRKLT
ncbi:hypothetical protein PR202_gb28341 [Eleusine coracana subsp. coracana]|uniref:DNA-directed RNA polymerases I, II, and III subunit RPABC3 n=1 Tax=Eleusine coracana subsp. coracana TaxID=191504 RepID=A0AAV5FW49_ELECO|nr:hypothetical protein PR202_gb28341 [Eleusine coracana subsp. coracana]